MSDVWLQFHTLNDIGIIETK